MGRKQLLVMLSAMMSVSACTGAPFSSIPCPRVTEFPADLQRRVADELEHALAAREMLQGIAADRAYNRSICP